MDINTYDNVTGIFRKEGDTQAKAKRIEYTESRGDEDVFTNFKETAKDIEIDDLQVMYVFMKKHWSSIVNYIKTGSVHTEPIEGRIMDLIQYLELLHARIAEKGGSYVLSKGQVDMIASEKQQSPVSEEKPQVINKDTMAELVEKKGIQQDMEC